MSVGQFFPRPQDKFPSIVFSAHKIMETKEDWAHSAAHESEGNFIRGLTHMEKEGKEGVDGMPVAWQEGGGSCL